MKRGFEGGDLPSLPIAGVPLTNGKSGGRVWLSDMVDMARLPRLPSWAVEDRPAVPFMWETVAFAAGLIWSLLFT